MPLWKFRSLAEAEAHLDTLPHEPENALDTALALLALAEGVRRGVRTTPRGLSFHRDLVAAESERERFAIARLRAADLAEVADEPFGTASETAANDRCGG